MSVPMAAPAIYKLGMTTRKKLATTFTTPPMIMLTTGVVTSPWACIMALVTSTRELNTTVAPR